MFFEEKMYVGEEQCYKKDEEILKISREVVELLAKRKCTIIEAKKILKWTNEIIVINTAVQKIKLPKEIKGENVQI